ncbi:uncharacterized protein AMSG_11075 [Thecamonas trahens ATCC 50062]|uniref:Uncharacterized protein n=1 Tax=Thecamonas trahens ATCC 50062 TaxID=461836 RepID=A0A0L0DST4_THETB|nr:hypothetical protein AMSG_11075 [Thecamonas trahens ATCC 50062]KNC55414.1 hypothetical protein AMSG_11075 [Thecamonas trahens ATCC 50062]|eukprot:XP_013752953.1 hypothetical protein AMSG_11075 [Thecamonas trahens ATCC 50062]
MATTLSSSISAKTVLVPLFTLAWAIFLPSMALTFLPDATLSWSSAFIAVLSLAGSSAVNSAAISDVPGRVVVVATSLIFAALIVVAFWWATARLAHNLSRNLSDIAFVPEDVLEQDPTRQLPLARFLSMAAAMLLVVPGAVTSLTAGVNIAAQLASTAWFGHIDTTPPSTQIVLAITLLGLTVSLALVVLAITDIRLRAARSALLHAYDSGRYLITRLGAVDEREIALLLDRTTLTSHTSLYIALPVVLLVVFVFWPSLASIALWRAASNTQLDLLDAAYVAAGCVSTSSFGAFLHTFPNATHSPHEASPARASEVASRLDSQLELVLAFVLLGAVLLLMIACSCAASLAHIHQNGVFVRKLLVSVNWRGVALRAGYSDNSVALPIDDDPTSLDHRQQLLELPPLITLSDAWDEHLTVHRLHTSTWLTAGAILFAAVVVLGAAISSTLRFGLSCSSLPAGLLDDPGATPCGSWPTAIYITATSLLGIGTGSVAAPAALPPGGRALLALASLFAAAWWIIAFAAVSEAAVAAARLGWLREHEDYASTVLRVLAAHAEDSHDASELTGQPSSELYSGESEYNNES